LGEEEVEEMAQDLESMETRLEGVIDRRIQPAMRGVLRAKKEGNSIQIS